MSFALEVQTLSNLLYIRQSTGGQSGRTKQQQLGWGQLVDNAAVGRTTLDKS